MVGVNRFESTEPSPLQVEGAAAVELLAPAVEAGAVEAIGSWRAARDAAAVESALQELRDAAKTDANLMPASIACAKAGVTTGEWGRGLRGGCGEFRAPTGVSAAVSTAEVATDIAAVRERVRATGEEIGSRLRMLVGKPGLDGHSNGAEQVAVRARDVGFEVIYQGIRLTPAQIVAAAVQEGVHVVGLSVLSGSHLEVVPAVVDGLRAPGRRGLVVGGIIPAEGGPAAPARGGRVSRPRLPADPMIRSSPMFRDAQHLNTPEGIARRERQRDATGTPPRAATHPAGDLGTSLPHRLRDR